MADVLAKGISSISDMLYDHLGFSAIDVTNNVDRLNRFVKYFASLKSKHDEQVFALSEIEKSKLILNQPSLSLIKKHDELLLLCFLHIIGHDVTFAYIHAINLAQQGDLMAKRTGYLMCSIFFNESHQFALLLINTILKDLQNPAAANECAALVATSQLVANGNIQTILPYVTKKLFHRVPILRKKALQCLYTMILKDSSLVAQVESYLFNCLKDPDPGVIWTAIEIYSVVSKRDPSSYRHLVRPLVKMIELVVGGKLSESYDYHGNPSPWFLMSLVRFISLLSQGCQRSTEQTTFVLLKLLEQTKTTHRVGFAVLFEVIRSVTSLDFISEELFEKVSEAIKLFLSAQSLYLRLTGLRLLSKLIPRKPTSALPFQSFIVDVLKRSERSLLRATIDLLFVMANESNKEFVCQKILELTEKVKEAWPHDLQVIQGIYQSLLELLLRFFKDDVTWFFEMAFQIVEKVDIANVPLNFDPRTLKKFFHEGDEVWVLESRKKVANLAMEKLNLIKLTPGMDPNGVVGLFSMQMLAEFNASAKLHADGLLSPLKILLPLIANDVNESGRRVLQSLVCLLPEVAEGTRKSMRKSFDESAFARLPIEPFCKLNLVEIEILLSKENGDYNPGSIEEGINSAFSIMDEYALRYLESGGKPYVRRERTARKIKKIRNKRINEINESDQIVSKNTSPEVNNQVITFFDKSLLERDELKFSKDASILVWSKNGCKQDSQANRSKCQYTNIASDSNKELSDGDDLSQQLFCGF